MDTPKEDYRSIEEAAPKSASSQSWKIGSHEFPVSVAMCTTEEMLAETGEAFLKIVDSDCGTSFTQQIAYLPDLPQIGKLYVFHECIGAGGFCEVRKAFDSTLHRYVAIKTLSDKHNDKFTKRNAFIAEAKVTAALDHPNIIPTHGLYTDLENRLHLVEKLVNGKTLGKILFQSIRNYQNMTHKEIVKEERRSLITRLEIFLKVCDAIGYAHDKQILHRDIKPENIMIGQYNEVYVMDWGIAESRTIKNISRHSVPGTLPCLAPEILTNSPYDSRSDIYSLGTLLYYLVYLKKPFPVKIDTQELIKLKNNGRVAPMKHHFGVKVPRTMTTIIRKAMAVQPSVRYQSVQALAADLHRLLRGHSVFESLYEHVRKLAKMFFYARH